MVVDDSAIIRRIAEKDLTALGIRHALCKNGSDAFHWLMGHSEECCGVLTDFEMPLM